MVLTICFPDDIFKKHQVIACFVQHNVDYVAGNHSMKDQKIRRLSRSELLEILVRQGEEIDTLRQELDDTRKIIAERKISSENAGSIARAALELNGVFEAAEKAAAEYVMNVKKLYEAQEVGYRRAEAESRAKAERMMKMTAEKCRAFKQQTIKNCEAIVNDARLEVERYRKEAFMWMQQLQSLKTEYDKYKKTK